MEQLIHKIQKRFEEPNLTHYDEFNLEHEEQLEKVVELLESSYYPLSVHKMMYEIIERLNTERYQWKNGRVVGKYQIDGETYRHLLEPYQTFFQFLYYYLPNNEEYLPKLKRLVDSYFEQYSEEKEWVIFSEAIHLIERYIMTSKDQLLGTSWLITFPDEQIDERFVR